MDFNAESNEILREVRAIEIRSKVLSKEIFSGEYHTAFKGRGMAFSEHREYSHGDEIRDIDWNVTARMRKPFIKQYQEEREITAMLLIDISASEQWGSRQRTKRRLISELAAVLAFSASKNNDKVGALLFSDQVEKFIPPKKGKSHILRIITEILRTYPQGKGTDIGLALNYLNQVVKKRSISFLLSDFKSPDYADAIKLTARRHDLVAFNIYDKLELNLPDLGIIHLSDAESGQQAWLNTGRKTVREEWNKAAAEHQEKTATTLTQSQVDFCDLATDEDYIPSLIQLFQKRIRR